MRKPNHRNVRNGWLGLRFYVWYVGHFKAR